MSFDLGGNDYFAHNQTAFRAEMRMAFGVCKPSSFAILPTVETAKPSEILAELRASDPKAAAMLGEFLVPDDDGNVTPEQVKDLCHWLGLRA